MHETIETQIAALNAIWQRYARTAEEFLDPDSTDALNRDYLAVWEGLEACGIEEWMLQYDPDTLTFSLAMADQRRNEKEPAVPSLAPSHLTPTSRWRQDVSDGEQISFPSEERG